MDYNVIIIGAGSGGYKTAELLADAGKNVLLVEKESYMGGVCLNWGCIPTKSYIAVTETLEHIQSARSMGIEIDNNYTVHMDKIKTRKDRIVKLLSAGLKRTLEGKGIDIITGEAILVNEHAVNVNNEQFRADNIVIATGSADADLKGLKRNGRSILNSKDILSIDYIPKSLAVVGGGVIGLEMASVFKALGSDVTVIEYMDSCLPGIENAFISDAAAGILKNSKIKLITGTGALSFNDNKLTLSNDECIEADAVLLAVGRKPVIHESFSKCGIETDSRGFIVTDSRNRTAIKHIYAAGDCTHGPMLAHKAYYDGNIIADDILGKGHDRDYSNMPYSVFLIPPLSHAGLSEEQCKKADIHYAVKEYAYAGNGRAASYGARKGNVKLIISDSKLLGASIWGKDSDTIIHELLPVIYNDLDVNILKNTVHIHPTLSEIVKEAME